MMKEMPRNSGKRDQLINQQRKKLQELRLQNQSENTKLLKIQQKEREVETEYQTKKKDMHDTLAVLAREAEEFLKEQDSTNKEFDAQKQQIYANDRKKQAYLKQIEMLRTNIESKRLLKNQKQKELNDKTRQLESLRKKIDDYKIYFEFLKDLQELSEEFSSTEGDDQGVMQIIRRYETLESKRAQLVEQHKKLENQKDEKVKSTQVLRSQNDDKLLAYTSTVKELKERIDRLNQQNVLLESEIEGKLNENNERLTQIGQIIFSIKNLYEGVSNEEKSDKTIIEMLSYIKDQRKKLKDIMELYQKPDQRKKT